jgi:hypothetical protein
LFHADVGNNNNKAAFSSYKLIRINVGQMALEENTAVGLKSKGINAIINTIDGISFHGLSIIASLNYS